MAAHLDSFQCFADRADLVHLDEDRIGNALFDATLQALSVGNEKVVAHKLYLSADQLGQILPALPVVLSESVFKRDNGILARPSCQ